MVSVITEMRLSPTYDPIISKQVQHHYSGFGVHIYIDGIRRYTLVYAGIGVVYARYTRGIREAFLVYAWYTRGIRAVYARYTRGICVVYAWYTRGIGWCTLVYAHDPPAPKRREPPAVILSIGSERSSQVTWDMAQDRCSEVMN